jgi:hypothetical protein
MINRIKEWDIKNLKINDRQVISLALILSVMALVMAIPSSSNCASANTCTVASTGTFTGNLGIKSNTAYQLTQQHSLAVEQVANWEAVGGNHTGSVIMKDNSGDMNLNGGLVLGTSATSTNGTIRWNGSEVQVYNSGWSGVGGADQNVFTTISGNTGSLTASTTTTSIKLEADTATGLTVVAAGDKLEIQSTGGGGYSPQCSYYAYTSASYTPSNPNGLDLDTELYDPNNCYTLSSSSTGSTITYTDSTTRVFKAYYFMGFNRQGTSNNLKYAIGFAVGRNQPSSPTYFAYQWSQNTSGGRTLETVNGDSTICLEQNKEFALEFPFWTNNPSILGGREHSYIMFNELPELSAVAQSNGCSNGLIN